MVRVAAVGTASTGKSALLNALFETDFAVDPRAGHTTGIGRALLTFDGTELEVIDSPPLGDAIVPVSADVYLLVCDKDLIDAEYDEAVRIAQSGRPLIVVLNKADMYGDAQLRQLLSHIRVRLEGVVPVNRIVSAAADPVRLVDELQPDGTVVERSAPSWPQVEEVLPALREAVEEARTSLRVQTREYAREAAGRVRSAATLGWKKLRERL